MLREALTALHAPLNTIEIRGYDHLVTGAKPSKLVRPAQPKPIEQLELPKITIEIYNMRFDSSRLLNGPIDINGNQYVDGEDFDTTAVDLIPAVEAPEPWLLYFQIELLSARQHDEISMIEAMTGLFGQAMDVDVSYSIAGRTITWTCHLHLVDTQHMSTGKGNEFEGRVIFSYSFEAWKWPSADPVNIPLLNERIIQRGASGTDEDDQLYDYVKNLDL